MVAFGWGNLSKTLGSLPKPSKIKDFSLRISLTEGLNRFMIPISPEQHLNPQPVFENIRTTSKVRMMRLALLPDSTGASSSEGLIARLVGIGWDTNIAAPEDLILLAGWP